MPMNVSSFPFWKFARSSWVSSLNLSAAIVLDEILERRTHGREWSKAILWSAGGKKNQSEDREKASLEKSNSQGQAEAQKH